MSSPHLTHHHSEQGAAQVQHYVDGAMLSTPQWHLGSWWIWTCNLLETSLLPYIYLYFQTLLFDVYTGIQFCDVWMAWQSRFGFWGGQSRITAQVHVWSETTFFVSKLKKTEDLRKTDWCGHIICWSRGHFPQHHWPCWNMQQIGGRMAAASRPGPWWGVARSKEKELLGSFPEGLGKKRRSLSWVVICGAHMRKDPSWMFYHHRQRTWNTDSFSLSIGLCSLQLSSWLMLGRAVMIHSRNPLPLTWFILSGELQL